MALTSTTRYTEAAGDGIVTAWPYTFFIPDASSLEVYTEVIATNVRTLLSDSLYTVTGLGEYTGGTVTYPLSGSPVPATERLIILRETYPVQSVNVSNQTARFADVSMGVWDKLTALGQDIQNRATLSIRLRDGTVGFNTEVPVLAPDVIIAVNAAGDGFVATLTATDVANAEGYANAASADRLLTAADVVTTNADAAQTALDTIAVAADLVLTNADVVLTGADVTATNADVVLTNADVVLTGLDVVSTAADATQTGLDSVATAADAVQTDLDATATAADAVATAADRASVVSLYDLFDDRVLGAKSSNPTLDNDGDALVSGTLFYDTTVQVLKVFDATLAAWATIGAYVHPNHSGEVVSASDGAQTIVNNMVTLAKMATVATATFLGRTTAATGNVEALTVAQAAALLDIHDAAAWALGTSTDHSSISPAKFAAGVAALGSSALTQGTLQATTSGKSITFTGIPAGVKEIEICFNGVSLTLNNSFIVQIGDSGGIEVSGYKAQASVGTARLNSTSGFPMITNSAARAIYGSLRLVLMEASTNTWVAAGNYFISSGLAAGVTGGRKALSGELTQLQLFTVSGTFDAGSVNILYR